MSSLSDRLRAVIGAAPGAGAELARVGGVQGPPLHSNIEAELGGEWRQNDGLRCFVVERCVDASSAYGHQAVAGLASEFASAADEAPLLANGAPVRAPFAFVDLETTGLSGGAGTHAFLVGCGWFDGDGAFRTRQFMLTRFADERALLASVALELSRAGAIVSFNGKSFDAPVLETRYLFHRLPWPGERLPHLDVLHPARRFWRDDDIPSCTLCALERQVLGVRRTGDVGGFEIPARYFQFIRSGDAQPLAAVLEHNRLDLLSLAGLTARLLHLVRRGPEAARDARETLAIGRVYARAGLDGRARHAFERAVAQVGAGPLRVEALRSLALAWRRARQFNEAAACWRALLDVAACPPHIAGEATEALAIHHEHRVRDFPEAKAFALRSMGTRTQASPALEHRLMRLELKIKRRASESLPLLS